jgi:WD40 repeat protein
MPRAARALPPFVAHGAGVSCLQVGPRSAGVLVTGGMDKLVNVWRLGKPSPLMTLAGHSTPVTSVAFDLLEESVAAGSQGGSVKVFALGSGGKTVRNLNGHQSDVLSLNAHPYHQYLLSGGADTNMRVWDVRRKSCLGTYRGHSGSVTSVLFSPDGSLAASGGDDGVVNIWDLTAAKLLHQFKGCHASAVTSIAFHPSEFLLATSSTDKTVKFWDIDRFELVSTVTTGTSAARTIKFHPDGTSLVGALHDQMKTFAWEPSRCLDQLEVDWSHVSDFSFQKSGSRVVACGMHESFVSPFIVKMPGHSGSEGGGNESRDGGFVAAGDTIDATSASRAITRRGDHAGSKSSAVDEEVDEDTAKIKTSSRIGRTPPRGKVLPRDPSPIEARYPAKTPTRSQRPGTAELSVSSKEDPDMSQPTSLGIGMVGRTPPRRRQSPSTSTTGGIRSRGSSKMQDSPPTVTARRSSPIGGHSSGKIAKEGPTRTTPAAVYPPRSNRQNSSPSYAMKEADLEKPTMVSPHLTIDEDEYDGKIFENLDGTKPKGLSFKAFASKGKPAQVDEDAIFKQMDDDRDMFVNILHERLKETGALQTMWFEGRIEDVIGAMYDLQNINPSICIDFFRHAALDNNPEITMRLCAKLLGILDHLLTHHCQDEQREAVTGAAKVLFKGFAPLVTQNRRGAAVHVGIMDVASEERNKRSNICHRLFCKILGEAVFDNM